MFDIDETALSNWDVMAQCGFCAYSIQTKLHPDPHGPAIAPILELYNFAKSKGIALFFVKDGPGISGSLVSIICGKWTDLIMQPDVTTTEGRAPARVFNPEIDRPLKNAGIKLS